MSDDKKKTEDKSLADDVIAILKWLWKNKETATLVVTAIGVIGAWVGLAYLGIQTNGQREQTRILQADYEARNRPYLAIQRIVTSDSTGNSVIVRIDVNNYGSVPATNVFPTDVVVGGRDVSYDENSGTYTFSYMSECDESSPKTKIIDEVTGTTITAYECYVTALVNKEQYPSDLLFFPGMTQGLTAEFDNKPVYEATVADTKVINIALSYSWATKSYYCLARATMQDDGSWQIEQQRGD